MSIRPVFALIIVLFVMACDDSANVAGSSTETTNNSLNTATIDTVALQDKSNIMVSILPVDSIDVSSNGAAAVRPIIGAVFTIDSLLRGEHILFIRNESVGAMIYYEPKVTGKELYSNIVLEPLGAIHLTYELSESVQHSDISFVLLGVPVRKSIDRDLTELTIGQLPKGVYSIRALCDNCADTEIQSVTVEAGKTTSINTPFYIQ